MTACDNCDATADAPTCTEHPTCLTCWRPETFPLFCAGCRLVAAEVARADEDAWRGAER